MFVPQLCKFMFRNLLVGLIGASLLYCFGRENPEVFSLSVRETFFNNQLSVNNKVSLPAKGDFKVDGRYLFEVGGRKKSFEKNKDEQCSNRHAEQLAYSGCFHSHS